MALELAGKDTAFLEQEFSHLLNGLMKKILGKGSANTEVHFLPNIILVRTSGVLTTQEKFLLENQNEGSDLIKHYRCKALNAGRKYFIAEIKKSLDSINIEDIYYDLNVEKDSSIIVMTLGN